MGLSNGVKIGAGITCGGCLTIILFIAGVAYFGQKGIQETPKTPPSAIPPVPPTPTPQPAASPAAPTTNWQYVDTQDPMGRGTIKRAMIDSSNVINFDFPYSGDQRGTLTLRKHPNYGKDVILEIEKGQFLIGIDGCTVNVRFDDGKPRAFSAVGPADHGTTSLFINNSTAFTTAAKKAKRIQIETQFFQEGARVFEFDSTGLAWD